ncbi:MAG: TetR/AcrR family transcriptional regulator [Propionibacteriaceae bacterium]
MSTGSDGPQRSDATRNRALVLEVARERLDTVDSLPPMKDLARLAGVGVGTVYRHFPTQQALLAELGAAGTRSLVAEVRAASEDEDPAAGLAHMIGFVLRGLVHDQAVCAALSDVGDGCSPPPGPAAELDVAVGELMRRAHDAGALRADINADDIRMLLVGVAFGLRQGGADDERLERHLRVLLGGLLTTEPSS